MTDHIHFPPADIGIVGGGQLARMTARAAIPLSIRLRVLAARADDSAAQICPDVMVGSPDDPEVLSIFVRGCQVVTFDHELVPATALARLEDEGVCLRPSPSTLAFAQDKRWQRDRLGALGFPVPPHRIVTHGQEIAAFAEAFGWPVVVKTPRGGYDGRGVWIVETPHQADDLAARLGQSILVEPWLPIEREVAVMVARRPSGQIVAYPVVETVQVDGICREVVAPAPIASAMAAEADKLARSIADEIALTGIMAVELFVAEGRLLINELATRPHNSGHFSIEGCVTSQFEQHSRAVLDWPLGSTAMTAPVAVMVNILGGPNGADPRDLLPKALALDGVHVHLYGKAARPGRKLGHVTVIGDDMALARERAAQAASILTGVAVEARR
ncbi:MAG: 5-(carboxyamino)imidazole ribonucleotide synthase [Thermomicrobiales bacterium]